MATMNLFSKVCTLMFLAAVFLLIIRIDGAQETNCQPAQVVDTQGGIDAIRYYVAVTLASGIVHDIEVSQETFYQINLHDIVTACERRGKISNLLYGWKLEVATP